MGAGDVVSMETRSVLADLGWFLLAVVLCLSVVIGGVWAAINILLFMGSFIAHLPLY